MFFLCVNTIKTKKINNINFISFKKTKFGSIALMAFSLNTVTTSTVNEEKIEDKEEYLNIKDTIIHVKINKKLNPYDKANNMPRYVATPFPPLNLNQIGKICPKKAIKAESCKCSGRNCCVMITGIYPFKISNIRVIAAKYLFPVLRTFVAPILPEPIFLISLSLKNLVKINPEGIEPLKYEKKTTNTISITY